MHIPDLLRAWRHHQHMSVREAAEQIGIPSRTLYRLEKGRPVNAATFAQIMKWMLAR